MTYGIKDLNAPFIQAKFNSLGELWKEIKGFGMFGIYRLENDGWHPIARRYFGQIYLEKNIKKIN